MEAETSALLFAECRRGGGHGGSADYVLFGAERDADAGLLDKIHRLDGKYMPLLDAVLTELLALSGDISAEKSETGL